MTGQTGRVSALKIWTEKSGDTKARQGIKIKQSTKKDLRLPNYQDAPARTMHKQNQSRPKAVFTLRTTSYDIRRCRPMSSDVAVLEHIDLTAVFTYRTMSYDGRHRLVSLSRTMSSNIVRQGIQRCRTMSCAV